MEKFKCSCGKLLVRKANMRCSKCGNKYIICNRCEELVKEDFTVEGPYGSPMCEACNEDELNTIYN